MIYFAIEALVRAGIDEVLLVTGGDHAGDFLPLLGDGSMHGLRHLDYTYQVKPAGIADALGLAESFAKGRSTCVMLADNVYEYSIAASVKRFRDQGGGARVLLAQVEEPQHYGVAVLDGNAIARIEEKPARPVSPYAVTGCYLYDRTVFDVVRTLRPSTRGELEITDVNNAFLARKSLQHDVVTGFWADCGESFRSYLRASELVADLGANKPAPHD
jgi:glucose-1-phosphate thymidylyltransferase